MSERIDYCTWLNICMNEWMKELRIECMHEWINIVLNEYVMEWLCERMNFVVKRCDWHKETLSDICAYALLALPVTKRCFFPFKWFLHVKMRWCARKCTNIITLATYCVTSLKTVSVFSKALTFWRARYKGRFIQSVDCNGLREAVWMCMSTFSCC